MGQIPDIPPSLTDRSGSVAPRNRPSRPWPRCPIPPHFRAESGMSRTGKQQREQKIPVPLSHRQPRLGLPSPGSTCGIFLLYVSPLFLSRMRRPATEFKTFRQEVSFAFTPMAFSPYARVWVHRIPRDIALWGRSCPAAFFFFTFPLFSDTYNL